ncbi:MAG TPA: OsmC family protein [Burkholderiales bacterium]|nr:OsmC family protein [Burkholderiales bacterium]
MNADAYSIQELPMIESTIRSALERLGAKLTAEPSKSRAKNAQATARLVDGLTCEITGPYGERLRTDMPPAMGGNASGPNPGWLLRGALASCTATLIAMRAATQGITLRQLEVLVESDSDSRGMLGLDDNVSAGLMALRVTVKIAGDAGPDALDRLVRWADAHSPVGCTLRAGAGYELHTQAST